MRSTQSPLTTKTHTTLHSVCPVSLFAEECDYVIAKATPRLSRSQVVSSTKSDSVNSTVEELSDIRTSQGMFFEREEDEMIKCEWLMVVRKG